MRVKRRTWTESEVATLREHFATMEMRHLCALLPHHSWKSIDVKGYRLGLRKKHEWTAEDYAAVRALYPTHTAKEIGLQLGIDYKHVIRKIRIMRLRKQHHKTNNP